MPSKHPDPKHPSARNEPDNFVGKIAIELSEHSTISAKSVQVGNEPGVFRKEGGGGTLIVKQPSGAFLFIQVWPTLGWGEKEIIEFALGVHVTADATVTRG